MSSHVLAQLNWSSLASVPPFVWGLAVCAIGLAIAFGPPGTHLRKLGYIIGGAGLIVLAITLPKLSHLNTFEQWTEQIVFWGLAAVAVVSSVAAVTARNPVYTAIWFAGSLLGVAGLFLFQGAQFLGFATIVVYAGAIVVTFLFVLMLANPEGHARYDRISWAKFPLPLMAIAAGILVAIIAASSLSHPPPMRVASNSTAPASEHMAPFGAELFARHMVAVEVAGTILLVALVGAVAIVIQGKQPRRTTSGVPSLENGEMSRE